MSRSRLSFSLYDVLVLLYSYFSVALPSLGRALAFHLQSHSAQSHSRRAAAPSVNHYSIPTMRARRVVFIADSTFSPVRRSALLALIESHFVEIKLRITSCVLFRAPGFTPAVSRPCLFVLFFNHTA